MVSSAGHGPFAILRRQSAEGLRAYDLQRLRSCLPIETHDGQWSAHMLAMAFRQE